MSHALLMSALLDELAALDGENAERIEAATAAKLAALCIVRDGPPLAPTELEQTAALNALAYTRTRVLLAGVDRRLRTLVEAVGRPSGLTYGRDGRTSL